MVWHYAFFYNSQSSGVVVVVAAEGMDLYECIHKNDMRMMITKR